MTPPSLQDRLAAHGLHLADDELAPFQEILADTDRIAAWVRAQELTYADEPATCFSATSG